MDQIVISQNENQEILINSNEPQVITLNNLTVQDIEINTNENQDLNISQPDNQVILIDGGGNIIGITDVLVNGVSVVSGNIAYVIVPTKTSELTNDSGFITSETDPTVPSYVKAISLADINNWNNKQNALVSGSTIKTINNTSLLGSGNIEIDGTVYTAGTGIDITNNEISNTITSYDDLSDLPTIPDKVSDLINDLDYVRENELADVAFDGSYTSLSNTPQIPTNTSELINDGATGSNPYVMNLYPSGTINFRGIKVANDGKFYYVKGTNTSVAVQNELMSGINIKTINNQDILGPGNLSISGGTPTDVQVNGTSITSNGVANIITESAYNSTTNKIATKSDIPTQTSQLTNNSNFAVTNVNNNFSTTQTVIGSLLANNTIVEMGSNTNGSYIKWDNGLMICYKTVSGSTNISTAWGSLYVSSDIAGGTMPQTFISTPSITYSGNNSTGTQFMISSNSTGSGGSVSNFGNLCLVRPNSRTGVPYEISFIAIGKWK